MTYTCFQNLLIYLVHASLCLEQFGASARTTAITPGGSGTPQIQFKGQYPPNNPSCQPLPVTRETWNQLKLNDHLKNYPGGDKMSLVVCLFLAFYSGDNWPALLTISQIYFFHRFFSKRRNMLPSSTWPTSYAELVALAILDSPATRLKRLIGTFYLPFNSGILTWISTMRQWDMESQSFNVSMWSLKRGKTKTWCSPLKFWHP